MNALDSIEVFREKWPFTARYARANGRRMHNVDEGAGDPISASSGLTDRLTIPARHHKITHSTPALPSTRTTTRSPARTG